MTVASADRLQEALRVARAIREFKAGVADDGREPIERKLRRMQTLRTPELPPEALAVHPYDAAWPALAAAEAARLRETLGGEVAAVEHFGSTAIPGMPAKSMLDLLVAVRDVPRAREALAAAGYEDYGVSPCDYEAVWLWDTSRPGYVFIVHLCAHDNPWIATAVNFRDYMRLHPKECASYEELKRRLRAEERTLLEYSILKLKLFYELSEKADAWAAAQGAGG
jgi:GrpB-like predicted nucleotidyltransferase (UPF0157 family)